MSGPAVTGPAGWYGKIPALGDFASRRLPPDFIYSWDAWLQEAMSASRAALGEDWNATYLNSQIWRYLLLPGAYGPGTWSGIMLPSVDKLGRQFPLTFAAALDAQPEAAAAAFAAHRWFRALEQAALDSLHLDATVEALEQALAAAPYPAAVAAERWPAAARALGQWWTDGGGAPLMLGLDDADAVPEVIDGGALHALANAGRGASLCACQRGQRAVAGRCRGAKAAQQAVAAGGQPRAVVRRAGGQRLAVQPIEGVELRPGGANAVGRAVFSTPFLRQRAQLPFGRLRSRAGLGLGAPRVDVQHAAILGLRQPGRAARMAGLLEAMHERVHQVGRAARCCRRSLAIPHGDHQVGVDRQVAREFHIWRTGGLEQGLERGQPGPWFDGGNRKHRCRRLQVRRDARGEAGAAGFFLPSLLGAIRRQRHRQRHQQPNGLRRGAGRAQAQHLCGEQLVGAVGQRREEIEGGVRQAGGHQLQGLEQTFADAGQVVRMDVAVAADGDHERRRAGKAGGGAGGAVHRGGGGIDSGGDLGSDRGWNGGQHGVAARHELPAFETLVDFQRQRRHQDLRVGAGRRAAPHQVPGDRADHPGQQGFDPGQQLRVDRRCWYRCRCRCR